MTASTRPAPNEVPLPTFLVIGAHRAATRWLRTNLVEHPEVYVTPRPIGFFTDPHWSGGFRGYRSRFREARGFEFVGELAPDYLRSTHDLFHVAKAFDDRLPDVRLVAIVRDPVERMFSAFRDHVIHGRLPLEADLAAMVRADDPDVRALDLVGSSRYGQNLYPFWRRYGDRLLIVVHDDIRTDPSKVFDQVLAHIGAPTGFTPSRLDQVLYSNAYSRWTAKSALTDEQRRNLYMLFRHDVEELEAMLGRFLPSWDPGPPTAGWEAQLPAGRRSAGMR
jgi:hypothetical protein